MSTEEIEVIVRDRIREWFEETPGIACSGSTVWVEDDYLNDLAKVIAEELTKKGTK